MDINKAIRKQSKSYKRFMLIMCFIFFALPSVMYVYEKVTLFLVFYLLFIEILIIVAVIGKKNRQSLRYECGIGNIIIWEGVKKKKYNINCDKIVFVHVEKTEIKEDIDIILVANSRFRNKNISLIDGKFLKEHGYISHEYTKIKKLFPDQQYYYIIISKGRYIKYKLLSDIFRNSVRAKYSDEAIECIKMYTI